ncbi:ABC transporter ATP-binding protein [Endozoicomonas elysicola]|uniref:ABC-type dipeptide transporter n=1 Tax=Endozoicomonas elysicola TaxID=305900 RepID=A0A081KFG4_9GAMM|nr:ABC transporter ATP-binding protein [Endozoicomonas elysicola]KEI72890.1 glutathione ABC transporter ATP-binding protein [Endozoicomonas elysicola]
MSKLLEARHLNVNFDTLLGTKQVLKDINIGMAYNEILAIVGESGSGKSVFSKSIMGLLGERADVHGSIWLHKGTADDTAIENNGLDLVSLKQAELEEIRGDQISMIFQDPMTSLNPVMTVGKQIAEAICIHQNKTMKDSLEEAGRLLDLVRVPSGRKILSVYPHQLSGGMRQRVMIAMALACKPKLLIADEPTTALDVTIQAQILGLIKELQKELNMAVIFITHDMGVVYEIADRVAVMYKGELVETGTLEQIFTSPQHAYTRALLAAAPKLGEMSGTDLPRSFPVLTMEEELAGKGGNVAQIDGHQVDYSQKPILTASNLQVIFPRRHNFFGQVTHQIHAVANVSFDLYHGETLGIVGESGSGKSTIGNAILGLLPEATGDVHYGGINLLEPTPEQRELIRKDISFIFQDPLASLNPRMTIGAAVEEPLIIHCPEMTSAEREIRAKELLQQVGIAPELYRHYPHEFSGGMLQRVNIARALTTNPKIIVADESVSALDVSVQATVLNLMMELQRDLGVSFIFISHDMAVIERVCHRVLVMTKGQLVEVGHRRAIFENTQHSYTRKLLAAIPQIDFSTRRQKTFELITDEVPDPVFPVGDSPAPKEMIDVSPGHKVAMERYTRDVINVSSQSMREAV